MSDMLPVQGEATDRIQKEVRLNASPMRVWDALTDYRQFGEWFRVKLDGPFEPGRAVTGQITYPGYEHLCFMAEVDRLNPESYFSFRWHPYAIDPAVDYSSEPGHWWNSGLSPTAKVRA